jgi:tRNA A37 methylthiotransferase MiaB
VDTEKKWSLKDVPSLKEFVRIERAKDNVASDADANHEASEMLTPSGYAPATPAEPRRFYIETYGCQMNESDTEIVTAILEGSGLTYTSELEAADVILANTCAIRENAEQKVWQRLYSFRALRRDVPQKDRPVIGVLGCMAERLKTKLLDPPTKGDKTLTLCDLVVGPDAYRDLPRLITLIKDGYDGDNDEADMESAGANGPATAANVQLSLDETYADITPVRKNTESSAYVSIMRGCNNMCAFCIVPFTRGRERSRPYDTVLSEVRQLRDQGVHEITLLGQNVNSYHDRKAFAQAGADGPATAEGKLFSSSVDLPLPFTDGYDVSNDGFSNTFRSRGDAGMRFAELIHLAAEEAPEVRFRFTSPHPKDFPPQMLQVVAEHANVCSSLHLPVQSGSTTMLKRMRRGYSRDAYLQLVEEARLTIPGVTITSDIIAGFCGETESEHADTISLMAQVSTVIVYSIIV